MTYKWEGINDGEPWALVVEVDRFADAEPFIVCLETWHHDGDGLSQTIATPTAAQARELAASLLVLANSADANNKRVGYEEAPA